MKSRERAADGNVVEASQTRAHEEPVAIRSVGFEYPDDFRAAWQPLKPEFSAACNALSLGMPYGEPYVVASVRRVVDDLEDPELVDRVRSFLTQEREHHR